MRPLGLSDTVLYNMRDGYITSAGWLDGPCDLPTLVAEVEGVSAAPGWSERPVRLGVWSFARDPTPVDLTRHMSVAADTRVRTIQDLRDKLERLRRNRFRTTAPPWRVIALNPAGSAGDRPGVLSGTFMQMRHGLADAARGLQAIARMRGFEAGPEHRAIAERLPAIDFDTLPQDMTIHDSGMVIDSVPRDLIPRVGDAGGHLSAVVYRLVHDRELFPGAPPYRGNYGRTRLVKRRGGDTGNHIRMQTIVARKDESRPAFRIPGLATAQDLPVTQWLVAVSPGPVARQLMRIWYDSFDAIGTLLPIPPRLHIAGQRVKAILGVPPFWGPVPLALIAMADREHYHVAAYPGRGFSGDEELLMARFRTLLAQPAEMPHVEAG